jgi:hypothetical protein
VGDYRANVIVAMTLCALGGGVIGHCSSEYCRALAASRRSLKHSTQVLRGSVAGRSSRAGTANANASGTRLMANQTRPGGKERERRCFASDAMLTGVHVTMQVDSGAAAMVPGSDGRKRQPPSTTRYHRLVRSIRLLIMFALLAPGACATSEQTNFCTPMGICSVLPNEIARSAAARAHPVVSTSTSVDMSRCPTDEREIARWAGEPRLLPGDVRRVCDVLSRVAALTGMTVVSVSKLQSATKDDLDHLQAHLRAREKVAGRLTAVVHVHKWDGVWSPSSRIDWFVDDVPLDGLPPEMGASVLDEVRADPRYFVAGQDAECAKETNQSSVDPNPLMRPTRFRNVGDPLLSLPPSSSGWNTPYELELTNICAASPEEDRMLILFGHRGTIYAAHRVVERF